MHRVLFLSLCFFACSLVAQAPTAQNIGTFSIVAHDPKTGDLGIAVASKFFGVGSVVPWARAGVGAVATQAYANTEFGPRGLAKMEAGQTAQSALDELVNADPQAAHRQTAFVDAKGTVAAHTGKSCMSWAGHKKGKGFSVQGNILAGEEVVLQMAIAYEAAQLKDGSELADWLLAALVAAEKAGGDKRGRQSAALMVVRAKAGYGGQNDRYVDIRVEDHADPIPELTRLLSAQRSFFSRPSKSITK